MNRTRIACLAPLMAVVVTLSCVGESSSLAASTTLSTEDSSPLPADPENIVGQFPNGMRYVIRHNANPPDKVYLDLAVRTGSLNETPEQNGLAHFLEHMAFKGSAHYAPMRLIPMLQHLGMQFGADTNAHTNQFETVFKLTMPDVKPETTQLALTIFSDFANGLSLYPLQIESERRVILEEMRSRMGIDRREQKIVNDHLFTGTRFATHDVLGNPEIIKHAPQSLFADYWNKWYRPEKMTLVVVGDIDPKAIIEQAKPLLGTFAARAPASPAMDAGLTPFDAEKALVLSDPERVTGEVELLSVQPVRPAVTTVAQLRREIIEHFAEAIVNRRMSDLVNEGKAPFEEAKVDSGDMVRDAFMVSAGADAEPQDWQRSLSGIIHQLKVAADRGFTRHEWDLVRIRAVAGAEQAVKEESTRDSSGLVTAFANAVDTDKPLLSSAQRLDLLNKITAEVTLADLQDAFNIDFINARYAYLLKLPAPAAGHTLPTDQEVLSVAHSAWQESVAATTGKVEVASLLPAEPAPGHVASREYVPALKLSNVTFDNGVVLHHRFSDYQKANVLVQIVMPGGTLEESKDNRGISAVASLMVDRPATSRMSSLQIRDLFSDKNVSVKGGIGLDSLSISVDGSPTDLPLGLQLVNAIITDGKLEQPAVDQWKQAALQSLRSKPTNASAQLSDAVADTLMGGDVRFAPLTAEVVKRQQREPAQAWFKRIADYSAIEITVVGDISEADATALVAKYMGSLPKRTGSFGDLDPQRHLTRAAGPYIKTVHYQSVEPKAIVMNGFVGCDEHDPLRRPLVLAGLILTDRMIQHIRFEQQLVYSISCRATPGAGLPGTGLIVASTPTDPRNADKLAEAIHNIIADFAAKGPTDDEVATVKKQIANVLASQMKAPSFWVTQFNVLQYHHRSLDELEQVPEVFQTFSAAQLRDAVRTFATDDRQIQFEVLPTEGAAASTIPAPTTSPRT